MSGIGCQICYKIMEIDRVYAFIKRCLSLDIFQALHYLPSLSNADVKVSNVGRLKGDNIILQKLLNIDG